MLTFDFNFNLQKLQVLQEFTENDLANRCINGSNVSGQTENRQFEFKEDDRTSLKWEVVSRKAQYLERYFSSYSSLT